MVRLTFGNSTKKEDQSSKNQISSKPASADVKKDKTKVSILLRIPVKWAFVIVLALMLLSILYFFRGLFVVALVNNRPIMRWSVVAELEKQYGGQVVDNKITEMLILQEASKKGVTVTQDETNAEVESVKARITEQNAGTLESILESRGIAMEEYLTQVQLELLVDKMLADKLVVTDAEIDAYVEQNKSLFTGEDTTTESFRATVSEQLKQQKASAEVPTWIQQLKQNANIQNWVHYPVLPSSS